MLAVLFKKIISLHRKFLILWIMEIFDSLDYAILRCYRKNKKRISSKESIEKK